MTEIHLEEIKKAQKIIADLNRLKLKEIQFFENGKPVEISEKMLDDWRFIGLNNSDFVQINL